jgi:hypothetical protein
VAGSKVARADPRGELEQLEPGGGLAAAAADQRRGVGEPVDRRGDRGGGAVARRDDRELVARLGGAQHEAIVVEHGRARGGGAAVAELAGGREPSPGGRPRGEREPGAGAQQVRRAVLDQAGGAGLDADRAVALVDDRGPAGALQEVGAGEGERRLGAVVRAGERGGPAHRAGREIEAAQRGLLGLRGDRDEAAAERDRALRGPALLAGRRPREARAAGLEIERHDRVARMTEDDRAGDLDGVERHRLGCGPAGRVAGQPGDAAVIGGELHAAVRGDHGHRGDRRDGGGGGHRSIVGVMPHPAAVRGDDAGDHGAAREVEEARERLAGAALGGARDPGPRGRALGDPLDGGDRRALGGALGQARAGVVLQVLGGLAQAAVVALAQAIVPRIARAAGRTRGHPLGHGRGVRKQGDAVGRDLRA